MSSQLHWLLVCRQIWRERFCSTIKHLRLQRRLSLEKAARLAGMEPELWESIERVEHLPTQTELYLLARGLGMKYIELQPLVQACRTAWQ